MPSGAKHAEGAWGIFLLTTGATVVITAVLGPDDAARNIWLFGTCVGTYMGIYITPDLDVDGGNISYKFVRKRFGRVGHWGWKGYWRDYARRHRHRGASHRLIIGTAGRWSYMGAYGGWFVGGLVLLGLWLTGVIELLPYILWFMAAVFTGNVIQDAFHTFMDRWF